MADILNTNVPNVDQALQTLTGDITSGSTNVPVPQVASLSLALPSYEGMDAQFKTFLDQASKDPGIVNYYNSLFQKAQGDYNTAVSYLEKDYQTGVRQTQDTLKNTLQSLGLTFTGESNTLADTLNKRGIALTKDNASAPLTYAGGGQAGTELGNLNSSQVLRNEAQVRSSQNQIQNMGISRQSGISQAGQKLAGDTQTIQGNETAAISSEAGNKYNVYQNETAAKAQAAQNQANNPTSGGSPLLGKDTATRQAAWTAAGNTGDLPQGWNG